jgi:hypothetical protein
MRHLFTYNKGFVGGKYKVEKDVNNKSENLDSEKEKRRQNKMRGTNGWHVFRHHIFKRLFASKLLFIIV